MSTDTPTPADPEPASAESSSAEERLRGDTPDPAVDAAALQRERDDLYDRLLRKTAEFDNYRKRIERERREQADQAVVDILQ
jgi:molecular chaperone GrpE